MNRIKYSLAILAVLFISLGTADAFSITIGKGDFYLSVGDYDYLPYGYAQDRLPRVSFYDMMSDYGTWVSVSPFGRAWRPYVYYGWQPYTYGHWTYTSYGPIWTGYEPWAWAAYHYGNWIWSRNYGWVWLPGYQWHPGRVVWSLSYNTIGWMPAPPTGYTYFCGYLCPDRYSRYRADYRSSYPGTVSPRHAESYDPFEFEEYEDFESDYEDLDEFDDYGGYRQDRYNDPFFDPYISSSFYYDPFLFNPAYLRIAPQLWVFIPIDNFISDNYSDYYYEPDFVRYLFDRRLVQVSRYDLDRGTLERVLGRRIEERPVQVRQLQTERNTVRVVIPQDEEQQIRTHANRVVKEVIAPAFVEKRKSFKGVKARHHEAVSTKVFKQQDTGERITPQKVETVDSQQLVTEAKKAQEGHKAKRRQVAQRGLETVKKAEREGKFKKLERVRQRVEKREERRKEEPAVGKRSVEKEQEAKVAPQNYDNWLKKETEKFQAWKEAQTRKFEIWKKRHEHQPEEIKRAEADFNQKLNKAQKDFEDRKKRAQEESGRSR